MYVCVYVWVVIYYTVSIALTDIYFPCICHSFVAFVVICQPLSPWLFFPPSALSYLELAALELNTRCAVSFITFLLLHLCSLNPLQHLELFCALFFFYIIILFQYFLYFQMSCPLSCPVLFSWEKGVFSLRAQSINPSSVLSYFSPSSLYPSLFMCASLSLSLCLTVTWIGSVKTTPSHWTRYSNTHICTVDTCITTWSNLCTCTVQWFSSSTNPVVHHV